MVYRPLIIIALDAADANLLQEWQDAGYLPALASIMQQGCWGRIGGDEYLTPHGLWMSLMSGLNKAEHGFYYYRQLQSGSYSVHPYDLHQSGAVPFWSAAASAGARIAILDVPETYPLPDLEGCQLSNFRIHNAPGDPLAVPESFLSTAIQLGGDRQVVQEKANSTLNEDRRFYGQLLDRIRGTGRLCIEILRRERADCTVIGFSEPHIAGHQLWKYRDGYTGMRDAIRNIYQEIDKQLELILQAAPSGANIYVISNTGIQDQTPTAGLLRSFCESLGYQVRGAGKSDSAKMIRFLRRLIPENLQAYTMYKVSAHLRQRMLSQIYPVHSDWSRTKVFVLPTSYTGMIRVNLKEREPFGIVETGAEYEGLLDQLEADLMKLIDPVTGECAIEKTYRTAKIYRTAPPEILPDLVIKWKPTKYYQEMLHHPRTPIRQKKPQFYRQNNHTEYGFFSASGPSIEKLGQLPDASLTSFAKSFLSDLGI